MKAFELSETAMMPMSEHSHGISAGEEGFKEINKVQVRERMTSRRSTKMMSCAQLEKHEAQVAEETKEQKWKKVIELLNNRAEYQVRLKYIFDMLIK